MLIEMGFVELLLMFTLSITSLGGSLASSSQLRANARILNASNVTVCPSDDYTLIFVCNATGFSIRWWFSPFIPYGSPLYIEHLEQGQSVPRDKVIVYITKNTTVTLRPPVKMIESQLHISTKSIFDEQSSLFQVVCASDTIEAEISIKKLVGSPPRILSASSNEMAVVTVNWSAENVDDIESLQLNIVSNTEEDIYTTCITDKENREIVVRTTLNPGDYEVTLVAFNICGENFNSKSFPLNIPEPQITPVQLQVSTVYLKSMSFCTPVAAQCPAVDKNTGTVAGLSNVLMVSTIALGLTLQYSTYI